MTRRALDLLVGGTLLAQATLAATPGPSGGHRPDAPGPAFAVSVTHHVPFDPAVGRGRPGRERPGPDTAPPAGGRASAGPSAAHPPPVSGATAALAGGRAVQGGVRVHRGGGRHPVGHRGRPPPPDERSVGRVHHYWQQLYRANRRVVGADPDLIHPGTRLDVLPFRSDQ